MITKQVVTTADLFHALTDADCKEVVVLGNCEEVPTIKLNPGQSLRGEDGKKVTLKFREGEDGVCCTADNKIAGLDLHVSRDCRAIYNDTDRTTLGDLHIENVRTVGAVHVVARNSLMQGKVKISKLHILDADSRGRQERPNAYGVDVIQGALTLWNMQTAPGSMLRAAIDDVSVGQPAHPVDGTGIFVCGANAQTANVEISFLRTGALYADGGIADGIPNVISGGLLVLYGVHVESVENVGPVETFGNNDMALDNWGSVVAWVARGPVTTHSPSAIGFVNFGRLAKLRIQATLETFGTGARGFNVYAGTVDRAEFDRIVTHGDGAVGIQISQAVGDIQVNSGVETFGATGPSLVKGAITQLSAIPVSVKRGGALRELVVHGGLITHEPSITPLELEGAIDRLVVFGGLGYVNN